jgi:hypothetical protein
VESILLFVRGYKHLSLQPAAPNFFSMSDGSNFPHINKLSSISAPPARSLSLREATPWVPPCRPRVPPRWPDMNTWGLPSPIVPSPPASPIKASEREAWHTPPTPAHLLLVAMRKRVNSKFTAPGPAAARPNTSGDRSSCPALRRRCKPHGSLGRLQVHPNYIFRRSKTPHLETNLFLTHNFWI